MCYLGLSDLHFSHIRLFATLWTIAHQAPLRDSPGKKTGVGCHAHLQGIFTTQGSNLSLLHCRWILYHWATREAYYVEDTRLICRRHVRSLEKWKFRAADMNIFLLEKIHHNNFSGNNQFILHFWVLTQIWLQRSTLSKVSKIGQLNKLK